MMSLISSSFVHQLNQIMSWTLVCSTQTRNVLHVKVLNVPYIKLAMCLIDTEHHSLYAQYEIDIIIKRIFMSKSWIIVFRNTCF